MDTEKVSAYELSRNWQARAKGENVAIIDYRDLPSWNEICSELSWQEYPLGRGHFAKEDHGYPGVYRLFGLATEGDIERPATLPRAIGPDTTGTLYVGKSVRLNRRANSMRWRDYAHNAIEFLERSPLVTLFPKNKLAIGLLFEDRKIIGLVETTLLEAYRQTFGDSPPLNIRSER